MASQLDQLGLRQLIGLLEDRQRFTLKGAQYGLSPNKSGFNVQELSGNRLADRPSDFTGYSPLIALKDFIESEQLQVAEAARQDLLNTLHYLTGTTYATTKELAEMGHPYAVRHIGPKGGRRRTAPTLPTPNKKTYFINKQSGELTNDFTVDLVKPEFNGGLYGLLVNNDSEQAGWLEAGTSRMIARPYDDMAVKMTQKHIAGVIQRAENAVRGAGLNPALIAQMQVQFDLGQNAPKLDMMQGVGEDSTSRFPFVSQDFFLKR